MQLNRNTLSEEENKVLIKYGYILDINNPAEMVEYGFTLQQNIADISDMIFTVTENQLTSKISMELTEVALQLNVFDCIDNTDKLQKIIASAMLDNQIAEANKKIDKAVDVLKLYLMELRKECALLDRLNSLISDYIFELPLLISAADKQILFIKDTKAIELNEKMINEKSDEAVVNFKIIMDFINLANKRISDISTSKFVAAQTSQIIQNIKQNDNLLADKIQSLCVNTLPVWKSQIYSLKNNPQSQNYKLVSNTNQTIILIINKLM